MLRRISPQEAFELMRQQGWRYVDVRSVPEFERGHPEGAFNVPLLELDPPLGGLRPNPGFLAAMARHFPRDGGLIVGCQMGGRSTRAAALLDRAGYAHLAEMPAGFDGSKDPMGRLVEAGWSRLDLPVTRTAPAERSWAALRAEEAP